MENKKIFHRLVYTFVHGGLGLLTASFLGGFIYVYCRTVCFINPKKKIYKEFAFLCRYVLWVLGTGFKKVGEIPKGEENFIVVCNHTNWIDAFFITAFFNGTPGVAFLDAKMFKYPILGYFLKKVDAIAIDRKGTIGWQAQREKYSAFEKSVEVLTSGTHLFIFPEGTRTPDGELSKFKNGAAQLAIETGKKILPLGLAGSYEFSNKKSWLLTPGRIILHAGEPIEYTGNDKRELTALMRSAVLGCVQQAKKVREEYEMLLKMAV